MHDVRRLAAALERDALHVRLARVAQEVLADLGGAGERDHVDVHVAPERLSCGLAVPGDHLQHAVGETRLHAELGQSQRRQR